MFSKETTALLHKSLPVLPQMVGSRSLKHDIDDLTAMVLPVKKIAIINDHRTARAFGNDILRALKGRFECTHITLEAPVADSKTTENLRQQSSRCDALVAVGSGTLGDLSKYASFLDNKPYIIFPTAASMNGYLSANASISVDGYKKTVAAHMPQAVFCDMSVISAAPSRLSKSGLGDSLARSTAQADWLLSHLLLGTPYSETPFELLKSLEPHLHDNARGITKGDMASMDILMQTLLLSGLGMTIAGGSYPASQAEHMIAHAMEMAFGKETIPQPPFHGEEIGVTTLAMAHRQEQCLRSRPALAPPAFPGEAIEKLFGNEITVEARKAYKIKQDLIEQAKAASRLRGDFAERIASIMIAPAKLEQVLSAAQCPATPEALGWDSKAYEAATSHARFLRDRFTFLDLA